MRHLITVLVCLLLGFFSIGVSAEILFTGKPDGDYFIYVMDDDGSNVTPLTQTKSSAFPRWSRDGKQIVFKNGAAIYLMHADGSHIRQLTHPEGRGHHEPIFSPTRCINITSGQAK